MNCYLEISDIDGMTCNNDLKVFVADSSNEDATNILIKKAEYILHEYIGARCTDCDTCYFPANASCRNGEVPKDVVQATFDIFQELFNSDSCINQNACNTDNRKIKRRTLSDSSISVEYADDSAGTLIDSFIPDFTKLVLNKYKRRNYPTSISLY